MINAEMYVAGKRCPLPRFEIHNIGAGHATFQRKAGLVCLFQKIQIDPEAFIGLH
jgi:hypothetical protein